MSNIPIEKRMQLIHMIREENKSNQIKLRNRENILYGKAFTPSLRSMEAVTQEYPADTMSEAPISTFKLRFLVAIALFVTYLILDMGNGSIMGKNAKEIYMMIEEDYQTNVFDFIENITYTLNDTVDKEEAVSQ